MNDQETVPCQICGKHQNKTGLVHGESVHAPIVDLITREYPAWSPDGYICPEDLNRFRIQYFQNAVEKEKEECASLGGTVSDSMNVEDHLPRNDNIEYENELTFGEHLADSIAGFAGSWTFIGVFAGTIILWVALNSYILLSRSFDPYPYILLNLALSILAAVQAPVIIMSQNRQEMRDRLHADRDFQVSIHTDREIHRLHSKIDRLMTNQGQKLLEIQNIQLELMEEFCRKVPQADSPPSP
jgi:uncharacterized membrane protein